MSIYNHALTNGLTEAKAESAVETFCEAYVEVVKGYVGNEDAELFEVKASTTPKDTALHKFLKKMQEKDEDKAVIKFHGENFQWIEVRQVEGYFIGGAS